MPLDSRRGNDVVQGQPWWTQTNTEPSMHRLDDLKFDGPGFAVIQIHVFQGRLRHCNRSMFVLQSAT